MIHKCFDNAIEFHSIMIWWIELDSKMLWSCNHILFKIDMAYQHSFSLENALINQILLKMLWLFQQNSKIIWFKNVFVMQNFTQNIYDHLEMLWLIKWIWLVDALTYQIWLINAVIILTNFTQKCFDESNLTHKYFNRSVESKKFQFKNTIINDSSLLETHIVLDF